ncbi:hypothetical protein R6Q57_021003 [Mikania cordata]
MWVFDYQTTAASGSGSLDLRKYKLRVVDWIHALVSAFVLVTIAMRDRSVVSCFYPRPSHEAQEVLDIVPLGLGLVCSLVFVIFPSKRHGSKMEPMDIVGKTKEDASLPKATMTKIIKEMLPPDVRVARDTQDLLIDCCVEFINLISSESNEVCGREDRRTIAPEHVLKALEVLGFGNYVEEVYAAYEQHKLETMDTVKGGKFTNGAEMTEEEALAEQQRMFAEARARMNGVATAPKLPEAESNLNSQLLEPL